MEAFIAPGLLLLSVVTATSVADERSVEWAGSGQFRLLVEATDWNRDGWLDIVAGAANGIVPLYLNTAR